MSVPEEKQLKMPLLQPGQAFERYTIERLLGHGGMGEVYLARHNTLGVHHALKLLFPDVASRGTTQVERFLREAQLASRIKHPNLIEVHDAGYSELPAPNGEVVGVYYIFMDYLPGGTLGERLRTHGRMSSVGTLEVLRQVAAALVVAEAGKMVHRDIKPDNIMFTETGLVKLADLGIAKSTSEQDETLTMSASIFGTPAYMSPEQARDASRVDIRADIYSLGCVAYEMLTGQRPYTGKNSMELLSQVVSPQEIPSVRELVPEVPTGVARLVSAMCRKDREKRIQTPKELVQQIEKLQGELAETGSDSAVSGGLWGKMRALFSRGEGNVSGMPPAPEVHEATNGHENDSIGLPSGQPPFPVAADFTGVTIEQPPAAAADAFTGVTIGQPPPQAASEPTGATLEAPASASSQVMAESGAGEGHSRKTSLMLAILVCVLAVVFLLYTYLNNRWAGHQPEPTKNPGPVEIPAPPVPTVVDPAEVYRLHGQLNLKKEEVMRISDLGQVFQKHRGDFLAGLEAGDLAERDGDLPAAYEFFRKASADAEWLLENAPLYAKASQAREESEIARTAADEPQVAVTQWARDEYQEATANARRGSTSFERGEFAKAISHWELAAGQFAAARKQALEQHQSILTNFAASAKIGRKWEELEEAAREMASLNPEVAERWMNEALEGKHGKELAQLRKEADEARRRGQWKTLRRLAKRMEMINNQEGAQWAREAAERELSERKELLAAAEVARDRGDWEDCLAQAEKLLALDSANSQAKELKETAEQKLKPLLVVKALVEGREVPAKVRFEGDSVEHQSGDEVEVKLGASYKATLEYRQGQDSYTGKLEYTCREKGTQPLAVQLDKMVAFDGTVTLPEGARGLRLKPMNNYWLGEDSVTQSQWKSVMHNNPSIDQKSLINPVDNITWEEAKAFCEWLNGNSDILRPPGYRFDLPTKAQCNSIDGNGGEWFLEMPHAPNVRRPGIHFRLALVPENP